MKMHNQNSIASIALGVLMVFSAVLAKLMTPVVTFPGTQAQINLESLIPKEFGGWRVDPSRASLIINPEVKGELDKLYTQILSRTYVNSGGERVMLAIAYGGVQKTDMHAHRPEICYTASGFNVARMDKTVVETAVGKIPVMRLVASQGERIEPVTYWIRVGDSLTRGWIEQKLTAIGYGLTGKVPDGLLVRVSSISSDEQESYRVHQKFLSSMLRAVRSEDQYWLVGQLKL